MSGEGRCWRPDFRDYLVVEFEKERDRCGGGLHGAVYGAVLSAIRAGYLERVNDVEPVEAVLPTGYDELKRASSIPNAASFEDGELPRAPDWTPFDGETSAFTPAFTNEDADMLRARLDAAEAEIKALQEEAQNARIRDQRTHGRIDGVVRRIAQWMAAASDVVMNEVGK